TGAEHKDRLGEIAARAGAGDPGIGMSRGSKAAVEAAETAVSAAGGVRSVLVAAGSAFGDRAGGTSGILWGLLLDTVGEGLGNQEPVTLDGLARAVRAGATRVQTFGHAELGDKTMLDALCPFADTLEQGAEAALPLAEAWRVAAETCTKAAEATAPMVPKVGRARPLAERSVGTPDPGAVSLALIVTAIGEQLDQTCQPLPEESS
ncbi:DAK2 domain-containing protein, partial [Nocardioides sp. NPDC057577]|uniref:DAK2 domain-containing protein n=1 Tax=Nocardioides sp. NPDC057577 TaxID=3346171 RepID=UPI00366D705A